MAAMGKTSHFLVAFVFVLFAAGCGGGGSADPGGAATVPAKQPAAAVVEDSMPEATVGTSPRVVEAGLRTGSGFSAAPEASGGRGFGADGVLAVRHGVHEGYERVVVDLGSGSEPAERPPEWSLGTPEGDGLLRLSLPSVVSTAVSDGDFGDGFLRDFHVVRAPEGGMFVDIVSDEAFTYRVTELTEPARLVVDFKSSKTPTEVPPPRKGGSTILTEPRAGAGISNPLTVTGYSRNFEAQNGIFLRDASGEVIARSSARGNDWSATWGYFEATLEFPEFTGPGTLVVGARSARDGSFEGVEVPVRGTG